MEEARRQELKAALIGGEDLMVPELWETGKDAVIGTIAYNSFAAESKTKEAAKFIELYKKEKMSCRMEERRWPMMQRSFLLRQLRRQNLQTGLGCVIPL